MFFFKNILFVALLIVICCLSGYCMAQHSDNNSGAITFKGNSFKLGTEKIKDTIVVTDPVSGVEKTVFYFRAPEPIAINGEKIYNINEVSVPPQSYIPGTAFEQYILNNLTNESIMRSLPDGIIHIALDDIIIDKAGRIVFYNFNGVNYKGQDHLIRKLPITDEIIDKWISGAMYIKPALLNSKAVNARLDISMSVYTIELKDHMLTYYEYLQAPLVSVH